MTATPKPSGLRSDSTIAVLIPHFRCEEWLGGCLDSLLAQTRAPEAIIVIDDASPVPPTECVKQFPGVTLLQSAENVGPYRLIQQVIDHTAFDGYMFQDADDWSGSRRLELLLAECERSGAELVGCQEMRLFPGGIDAEAHRFPADGRELILSGAVGYPVLHPASLVSRSLVVRLGSYATGMRISGDSEFQRRAIHSAHVTNIPEIAYYRRARADSLTSSSVTGRGTPVRNAIRVALSDRWKEARAAVDAGMAADLSPMSVRGPVELRHLTGPKLTGSRVAPTKRSWRQRSEFQRGRRVWRGLSANLYHWSSWIRPRSPLCGARTSSEAVARPRSRLAHSPDAGARALFRGAEITVPAAENLVSRRIREVMPPFRPEWRLAALAEIECIHEAAGRGGSTFSVGSLTLKPPSLTAAGWMGPPFTPFISRSSSTSSPEPGSSTFCASRTGSCGRSCSAVPGKMVR